MENHPDTTGLSEIALANAAKGIVSIPCHPGTKIPAVKWKPWQERMPPDNLLREWFADARRNIAVLTTSLVIFDVDDVAKVDLVLERCGDTPYKVRTPRGVHLGYRKRHGCIVGNHVKVKGIGIDIRAENGLALIPPSRTEHGAYEWLGEGLHRIAELPIAKIGWTRQRSRKRLHAVTIDGSPDGIVRRARAYIARIPGAISGQNGHGRTFRVACVLVQKFGLAEEQAWPLLLEFNARCDPPWTEKELKHKLSDALSRRYPAS